MSKFKIQSNNTIAIIWQLTLFGMTMSVSCTHDRILPIDAVCGDGKVYGTKECDTDSPGCNNCMIEPGWECPDNICSVVCGDGIVVEGFEDCDYLIDQNCDSSCHSRSQREKACDMTGHWIIRQTDFSRELLFNGVLTSSNWYYLQIVQDGDHFVVTKALFCGLFVSGGVDVAPTERGIRALMYKNPMAGSDTTPPRGGTSIPKGDICTFDMDRFYFVRGGLNALLPKDFSAEPDLSYLDDIMPYSTHENKHDLNAIINADLAQDSDEDGLPGVAFNVSGIVSATRNVVQVDWNEYHSDENHQVTKLAGEFVVRSDFDNREEILYAECPANEGGICSGLLIIGSVPAKDITGYVTFLYLGPNLESSLARQIIVNSPGLDEKDDFGTCTNIRNRLKHTEEKR